MSAMPTESGSGPGVGHDLSGYVLVPARWVEHYERLLEEHEDAEAAQILADVRAGREQVFTHDEVWGNDD
ncbi:hypothetical protein [Nocardiopsis alborubida]|uniref:Uncharacterized protein n=1 Tax=Nocardiopsis alborubida TaxID=146802 RepID=A0A7X6MFY1_9ACTN|nr:hypothetical protein [Nocardiopsis alborubida]NKZ00862.1 hypothetical protein [Nocardiopsis alborubida]